MMLSRIWWFALSIMLLMESGSAAAVGLRETMLTISVTNNAVQVIYDLPAEVTSLSLGNGSLPPAAADIRVREASVTLDRGTLSARTGFRRVTLLIRSDSDEIDSIYPMLLPVAGKGVVLFAPYILPSSGPFRVGIVTDGGAVHVLRDRATLDGYVIIGAAPEKRGAYRSLVSMGMPDGLRDTLLDRTGRLLAFYRARLHLPLRRMPTVVMSYAERASESGHRYSRGDVTPNGVVFLRIYGSAAQVADPSAIGNYTGFLSHELFHLWGEGGETAPRDWWLHEGGAEYASWVATATLWPADLSLDQRVGGALRGCASVLQSQPLGALEEPAARGARYPCGAVMQWIADLGARSESGRRDSFAIWRRFLVAKRAGGLAAVATWRGLVASLAPRAVPAVDSLIDGAGAGRWPELAVMLNRLGASVDVQSPLGFSQRVAAMQALILSSCGELRGVGEDKRGLYVQAPPGCVLFGDAPVIEKAEGIEPMADPSGFYRAIVAKCAARSEVALVLNANGVPRTARAPCTVAVEPPLPEMKLIRALPPMPNGGSWRAD
ncbi:hypothetical protein ACVWZA_002929 [Sphingomonas sp. UYAg733]